MRTRCMYPISCALLVPFLFIFLLGTIQPAQAQDHGTSFDGKICLIRHSSGKYLAADKNQSGNLTLSTLDSGLSLHWKLVQQKSKDGVPNGFYEIVCTDTAFGENNLLDGQNTRTPPGKVTLTKDNNNSVGGRWVQNQWWQVKASEKPNTFLLTNIQQGLKLASSSKVETKHTDQGVTQMEVVSVYLEHTQGGSAESKEWILEEVNMLVSEISTAIVDAGALFKEQNYQGCFESYEKTAQSFLTSTTISTVDRSRIELALKQTGDIKTRCSILRSCFGAVQTSQTFKPIISSCISQGSQGLRCFKAITSKVAGASTRNQPVRYWKPGRYRL